MLKINYYNQAKSTTQTNFQKSKQNLTFTGPEALALQNARNPGAGGNKAPNRERHNAKTNSQRRTQTHPYFFYNGYPAKPRPRLMTSKLEAAPTPLEVNDCTDNYKSQSLQIKINKIIEKDQSRETPIIKKIKSGFIDKIINKITEKPATPVLIGIAGASASGKTFFTDSIIDKINQIKSKFKSGKLEPLTVLNGDHYFKDISGDVEDAGGFDNYIQNPDNNLDRPEAVNLEKMKEDLISLKNGKTTWTPKYEYGTCRVTDEGFSKNPAHSIIAEGIFALHKSLSDIFDIKVFIETSKDILKERWLKRATDRGSDNQEKNVKFLEKVEKSYKEYIEPVKNDADIVINGESEKNDIKLMVEELYSAVNNK